MKELNVQQLLSQPQGFIFSPFQEELCHMLLESITSVNLYNCSNASLVKRLNQLNEEELLFLFSQAKTSIFSYVERLSSFPRIVDVFSQNEANIQLIAIGQSKSFIQQYEKLSQNVVFSFHLSGFSQLLQTYGIFQAGELLSRWLVYGMNNQEKKTFDPASAAWRIKAKSQRINKPRNMDKTLVFLANHVHKTLGYNEIGYWCDMDNETAQRYVCKLSDYGIVVTLPSFSSRKKYEFVKGLRVGFLDNGILNTFKNNFSNIDFRVDVADLWKNWLIAEKIKKDIREQNNHRYFFWQSHTRQNIDLLVVSSSGERQAFIIVWKSKRAIYPPTLFTKYYPDIPVQIVNPSNYLTFLSQ